MKNEEQKMIGVLLRLERMKQRMGQKEVCYGICVPSYLSKIEHGTVAADNKILEELFHRLGITYISDEAFCNTYQPKIEKYFEQLCYALKTDYTYTELKAVEDRLSYSRFVIDWLLIEGFECKKMPDLLSELEESMTDTQKAYYMILQFLRKPVQKEYQENVEKAFAILKNSYSLLVCCYSYMEQLRYTELHKVESQLTALALEEGNIYALAYYYFLKGSIYATVDMEETMMTYYQRVIRMLQNTNWANDIGDVYYNMGATCLSLHKYDMALEYLEKVPDFTLGWHKRALASIRKGDIEKGKEFLEKMYDAMFNEEEKDELSMLRYEEACWECREHFLENPDYLELLENLVHQLQKRGRLGGVYFYREILVAAYKKQRKYKKALEFQEGISSKMLGIEV